MDSLLQGLNHVVVYLDDIVVTGSSDEEHIHNLGEVLSRLSNAGIHLKREKCSFFADQVEYLGHLIDKEGLHPTDAKVEAVQKAPAPSNVSKLKSFLGLLNYYSKFLPNLSSVLSPLYSLLQADKIWTWGHEEEESLVTAAKALLSSSKLLVHYDPNNPLMLSCDASSYGVGAVLSHQMQDGSEKPIGFASRTMSATEKKYSQLDKEALALMFGISKFHQAMWFWLWITSIQHQSMLVVSRVGQTKTLSCPQFEDTYYMVGQYLFPRKTLFPSAVEGMS